MLSAMCFPCQIVSVSLSQHVEITCSLWLTDVITLLETYTIKFAGKIVPLTLDMYISTVAERIFNIKTAFETSTSIRSFALQR